MRLNFAWFEWYPAPPVAVPNFPVSAGDVVFCAIVVNSPVEALVYLTNVTRRTYTSFIMNAPDGVMLQGDTVEWVLESPTAAVGNWLGPLAKFGQVYFDGCVTITSGGAIRGGDVGTFTMHDVNGNEITGTRRVGDRAITTWYWGPE